MCVSEVNRIEELLKNQTSEKERKADKNTGRDARGRFTVGNPGGPGNPYARRVAVLRGAMLRVVEERNMENVMRKCIELAEKGNLTAMRMFLQYTVGKPLPAVNPDHLDNDEWKVFQQSAQMSTELGTVMKSLEPEIPLEMARNVRPILSEMARDSFVDALLGEESSMAVPAMRTGGTPVVRQGSPSTNGGNGDVPAMRTGGTPVPRQGAPSTNGGDGGH